MATCVGTSTARLDKSDQLSRNPNRGQTIDHSYSYVKVCRPTFSDRPPAVPASMNGVNNLHSRTSPEELHRRDEEEEEEDDLWAKMQEEARFDVEQELILSSYYHASILCHQSLEIALANHLSLKLCSSSLPSGTLIDLFVSILNENEEIMGAVKYDLRAVKERDPACISYVHCFLNFKGFLAIQAHRIAHQLWSHGRNISIQEPKLEEALTNFITPPGKECEEEEKLSSPKSVLQSQSGNLSEEVEFVTTKDDTISECRDKSPSSSSASGLSEKLSEFSAYIFDFQTSLPDLLDENRQFLYEVCHRFNLLATHFSHGHCLTPLSLHRPPAYCSSVNEYDVRGLLEKR